MFKNKEDFLRQRSEKLDIVQALLEENKHDEANKLMSEVDRMDVDWKAQNKDTNINATQIDFYKNQFHSTDKNVEEKPEYKNVFAKVLLNKVLSTDEIAVYNEFNPENAYSHTSKNSEILIPETVVDEIWSLMEGDHPFVRDVERFQVRGTLTRKKHTAIKSGDAKWYSEDQVVEDEQNQFSEIKLTGHDLAKAITVSWRLKSMSVEDFLAFIERELADRMGAALATGLLYGNGKSSNEPKGLTIALVDFNNKSQVQEYKTTEPTYKDMVAAISKIHKSLIHGAKIYVNNTTLWKTLAAILDADNRPYFVPSITEGSVGRMLGLEVAVEPALKDGDILIGNAKGYNMNENEAMRIVTEDHAKKRETDYVAYGIYDGDTLEERAFALLRLTGIGDR